MAIHGFRHRAHETLLQYHLKGNLLPVFITDFWQFYHKSVAKINKIAESTKTFG